MNWELSPQWLKAAFLRVFINLLTSNGLVLRTLSSGTSSNLSSSGGSSSAVGRVDFSEKNLLKILVFSFSQTIISSFSESGGIEECLFFFVSLNKMSNFFFAVNLGSRNVPLTELYCTGYC